MGLDQDTTLDNLSRSIHRQHDVSLQINDELAVHVGLLEELDTEVDHIQGRLGGARRRLDRVAKGARENGTVLPFFLSCLPLLMDVTPGFCAAL
jgi:syntaxin 8